MAETQYRRLTWPRRRNGTVSVVTYSRSSLWLGNDHLLVVVSNGYSETYKRFYFRDIQAIAIRLTRRRMIWNWVLGVPIAMFLLRSAYELSIHHNPDLLGIVISVLRILLPGIPLLINNLLGSTCACTLRTAVQTEELPSLCRLPKTRRILNLLRPLIAQAQGQIAPEEIPARLQVWHEATAPAAHPERAPAEGDRSDVPPSSGAESSAAPTTLEGSETSPLADVAAPGDGRTPAAQPTSAPAEAQAPYVVDDPNLPPRMVS
jgi:hypothetical protein